MRIINNFNERNLDKIANLLEKEGNIFAHHTGNMLGIGASAFDKIAIERISNFKNRENSKGYIILIPDISWLQRFGIKPTPKEQKLLEQYWPNNLTVVFKCEDERLSHVALDGTVAFRVPTAVYLRHTISYFGSPIISTSINKANQKPYDSIENVKRDFADEIDFAIMYKNEYLQESTNSTIIGFDQKEATCFREGDIAFEEIKESYEKPLINFVCTGNICRSPMAEYLMKKHIKEKSLPFRSCSSGFLESGNYISANSSQVLKDNGMNAVLHKSTRLEEDVIRKSWILITMTEKHKIDLIDFFPNTINKVFTLGELANEESDVADPYGMDLEEYKKTYEIIKRRIDKLIKKMI